MTMKAIWAGCALMAASLAMAETPAPTDANPYSAGSAQDGATKAAVCTACHGPNGNSVNPDWPVLAGQNAVYIAQQLRLFKAGIRVNPVMQPMVANLSDKDIADLAVYFSSQTPAGHEADPSFWKAGEQLYRRGDRAHNIPACVACHGPVGRGNPAAGFPALRTQHAQYTVKQLNDYASGQRYAGAKSGTPATANAAIMSTVAKRLTPEDTRNLASYVQGLR